MPKEAPVGSHARLYYIDMQGQAAACTVAPVKPEDGKETAASMKTGGGGWCAISVSRDGNPYATGLLVAAPRSGKVFIHAVGDDTRIDYTPKPGAVGADSFAVRLIPGDAVIRVAVGAAAPGAK